MFLNFKYIESNEKTIKQLKELEKTTNEQIINNFKLINKIEELNL